MDAEIRESGSRFFNAPHTQSPDCHQSSQHGFVLIWVGLGMLFFLGMAALVIDAAYLYLTKKQLSVAADSGALAGATQIFKTNDCGTTVGSPNYNARPQAQQFAGYNKATGSSVTLDLNLSNIVGPPEGDILLGNFNKNNTPRFTPCSPATDFTTYPTNAVRVHVRKTGVGGNPGSGIASNARVPTFFASVLNPDFSTSGVEASATAQKITKSTWPIAVPYCAIPASASCCPSGYSCSGTSTLTFNPSTYQNACWTTFFQKGGASDIRDFIADPPTIPCTGPTLPSQSLNLFNGTAASALKDLQDQCLAHSCSDTNPWYIQLPVIDPGGCPPTYTLQCNEDPPIIGFVSLGITQVDAGGGKGITGNFICDPNPPIGNAQCSSLVE
jgi:Flp pilus assembly protein TadG